MLTWMKLATWRTSSVSAWAHAISWSSGSGCTGGNREEGGPFVGVGVSPPPRHSLPASHSIASSSDAASCTSLSESRRALTRGRSFEANPLSGALPAFPSVPAQEYKNYVCREITASLLGESFPAWLRWFDAVQLFHIDSHSASRFAPLFVKLIRAWGEEFSVVVNACIMDLRRSMGLQA